MALINCPECNEKISDTASQCVHCGVKICVCPECKTVYTESVTTCKNCGFEINKPKATVAPEGTDCKTASEVIKKWERSEPMLVYLFKGWILFALIAVAIGLCAIGVVTFFTWKDILTYKETLSNIKTLMFFAAFFFALWSVYGAAGEHFKTLRLARWCKRTKVDFNGIIGNSLSTDFDTLSADAAGEELGALQWCIAAAAYAKKMVLQTKMQTMAIIMSIISVAEAVFLNLFLVKNISILMEYKFFYGEYDFKLIENWWMLAVVVVLLVVYKALDVYMQRAREGESEHWVRTNLPNLVHVYIRYVPGDKMVEYLMRRGSMH